MEEAAESVLIRTYSNSAAEVTIGESCRPGSLRLCANSSISALTANSTTEGRGLLCDFRSDIHSFGPHGAPTTTSGLPGFSHRALHCVEWWLLHSAGVWTCEETYSLVDATLKMMQRAVFPIMPKVGSRCCSDWKWRQAEHRTGGTESCCSCGTAFANRPYGPVAEWAASRVPQYPATGGPSAHFRHARQKGERTCMRRLIRYLFKVRTLRQPHRSRLSGLRYIANRVGWVSS